MIAKTLLPLCFVAMSAVQVFAEDNPDRTAPFTAAERETAYSTTLEKRTGAILQALSISDTNKSAKVHDTIVSQYRALRARDEALDSMFSALSKNAPGIETNRSKILAILSSQLHEQFLARLAQDLTPDQIEVVKDRMTYNKVKVTFDAYCEIIPKLSESEKAMVLDLLKTAREEAMDGGSADEKTAIFQKYKDQINAFLNGNGHNVAQATKEWEAKHPAEGVRAAK